MIIDISFEKERSVQEMMKRTVEFWNLDYESKNTHYICTQSMLFSVNSDYIHISSIFETDFEIQLLRNYIKSLFEGRIIGISCIGFKDRFQNIQGVEVLDITPRFYNMLDK